LPVKVRSEELSVCLGGYLNNVRGDACIDASGKQLHDGVIAVDRSDERYCSDGFEISCRNGERVRVAFSLDCCDRQAIAFAATTAGISGELVRDVMVEILCKRFGEVPGLRSPAEWLSDNGSGYIARETHGLATAIGLKPCRTPIRSPQSNGMAESFVKNYQTGLRRYQPDARCAHRSAAASGLLRRIQSTPSA
jgi:putative transposase